jgi:oligoribonuclease
MHSSPQVASTAPRKKGLHKAREDILESIEEARHYREFIFQKAKDGANR